MKKILAIKYKEKAFPVLEVTDKNDEVRLRFIHTRAHYTLHVPEIISKTENNVTIRYVKELEELPLAKEHFIFTEHDEDYPGSTWKEEIINIVRNMGVKFPERHAHYLQHKPLYSSPNQNGYNLGGRRLNLRGHYKDNKYPEFEIIGTSDSETPMLETIFSTPHSKYEGPYQGIIKTKLGDLCFAWK